MITDGATNEAQPEERFLEIDASLAPSANQTN
jgi:hypothetical protein